MRFRVGGGVRGRLRRNVEDEGRTWDECILILSLRNHIHCSHVAIRKPVSTRRLIPRTIKIRIESGSGFAV